MGLIRIGEEICLLCIHWPVCRINVGKGREYITSDESDGLKNDFGDFLRMMARSCDNWQEDGYIKGLIEEHKLLKRIFSALEEGKIIVWTDSDIFEICENDDEVKALIATNGNRSLIVRGG